MSARPSRRVLELQKGNKMKQVIKGALAAGMLALTACGGGADDQAAENVEAAAENQSEALEAQAENATGEAVSENLQDRAETVEEAGEEKAEAIDDNDNSAAAANAINGM